MLLCLVFGFSYWFFDRRNRTVAAGIALGLASFKVTLVAPFVLLAAYRRRWWILIVSAVVGIVLIAAFLALNPDTAAAMESYRGNVDRLRNLVFSPDNEGYPIAFKMVSRTELAAVSELLIPGSGRFDRYINLIPFVLLMPFWFLPLLRRQVSDARAFLFFAVISLLCSHHLHYDCLVLLPLYLLVGEVDRIEQIALAVGAGFFLVPINGLLSLITLPPSLYILLYNVQIGLVILAVVLTWGLVRRRSPGPAVVR
jgi:hypothetical protein